jgi:hypothetical protein
VKPALPIALLALLSASPAFASGTIHCSSTERGAPEIYLVVGRGAGAAITGMHLSGPAGQFTTGAGAGSPAVSQSWLDERDLRIEVVDSNAEYHVARLIGRRAGENLYRATLRYRGRTHAMSCAFED